MKLSRVIQRKVWRYGLACNGTTPPTSTARLISKATAEEPATAGPGSGVSVDLRMTRGHDVCFGWGTTLSSVRGALMSRQRAPRVRLVLRAALLTAVLLPWAHAASAEKVKQRLEHRDARMEPSPASDPVYAPQKALQDTVWAATWTMNSAPQSCVSTGWVTVDNRILNDAALWWSVAPDLSGIGGISGNAALLGYVNDVCRTNSDGYANDWYQAIRITYTGAALLTFNYVLDSEAGGDFLRVESDSLCSSFVRVNYTSAPDKGAAAYRTVHFSNSGLNLSGTVSALALPSYDPGTDCVYIAFFSDGAVSPADGAPTTLGRALGIDNISITDVNGTRSENFTDGILNPGTFVNIQEMTPFGSWARTYSHATDNDLFTEDTSCSIIWTDNTTPTLANDPSMAFGPGGYVVRHWLDNSIVSPWVSRSIAPLARRTLLQFRSFPGNPVARSRIVLNWSVRTKTTSGMTTCVGDWKHANDWLALNRFGWATDLFEASRFVDPEADFVQVRFRVADWQLLTGAPPSGPPPLSLVPGPGPYLDDIRIGYAVATGPLLNEGDDGRSQAQDCFPTEIHPGVTPAGEHFRPTTDRFGTCAFTRGGDLGAGTSPNLITGDSITVDVFDARGVGILSVDWYGSIVSGPHVGKAPAPWVVGANGFFHVPPDSSRTSAGVPVPGIYFVDLDDTYFRGGDVLWYVWLASDSLGGTTSDPPGLSGAPTSVPQAQAATGGLQE